MANNGQLLRGVYSWLHKHRRNLFGWAIEAQILDGKIHPSLVKATRRWGNATEELNVFLRDSTHNDDERLLRQSLPRLRYLLKRANRRKSPDVKCLAELVDEIQQTLAANT